MFSLKKLGCLGGKEMKALVCLLDIPIGMSPPQESEVKCGQT